MTPIHFALTPYLSYPGSLLKIRSPALQLLVLLFYVISFFACSQILEVLVGRKSRYTSCCCCSCCYYQASSPHLLRSRHDKDTKHLFTNVPEHQNDATNTQESPSNNTKFFTETTKPSVFLLTYLLTYNLASLSGPNSAHLIPTQKVQRYRFPIHTESKGLGFGDRGYRPKKVLVLLLHIYVIFIFFI
jgi:hypothetical protein